MNQNPNLKGYSQADIEKLVSVGFIVPKIDSSENLIIQNVPNQMYSSSITIELRNALYIPVKVETKIDPTFYEL